MCHNASTPSSPLLVTLFKDGPFPKDSQKILEKFLNVSSKILKKSLEIHKIFPKIHQNLLRISPKVPQMSSETKISRMQLTSKQALALTIVSVAREVSI